MYSSSPPHQCPSTPLAPRNPLTFKPLNSSPLTRSPDRSNSSPVVAAQVRRRSQYKAPTPKTPAPTRILSNSRRSSSSSGRLFTDGSHIATPPGPESQKTFLRDRFKARCFERAAKARARAIKGKRYANEPSSEDFIMDYDEEDDDDEDIMQDELFRRIMANATRKEHHSYRLSYVQEVGSSFDPDLEDVAAWEQELKVSMSEASTSKQPCTDLEEKLTPVDLDDEELEAYAEECAQRAALADFDDIPEEELFNWSDFEEPDELSSRSEHHQIKSQPSDEYDMDIGA